MKAVTCTTYGRPDTLEYKEVAKPIPRDHEVLVKLHAASINSWDWELLQGIPFLNRLSFGLFRPTRIQSLGADIAGVVEAVGSKAHQFKPGDEVFGDLSHANWGGFAEYVTAPEHTLSIKPANLTFEQAAAVPQAGLLAWQSVVDQGKLRADQHVLINGASGGSGSFAIQIAKEMGAEVTGVCRGSKMDFVRSLGADHVIDYTTEDFTQSGRQYDLIIDMQAHHSLKDYQRALKPGGAYIMVGGETFRIFQALFISLTSKKKISLLLHKPNKRIEEMKRLLSLGKVTPQIDKVFPLSQTIEAMEYFAAGNAKGKVIITMEEKA